MLKRRTVLQVLLSALSWAPAGRAAASRSMIGGLDADRLRALAEAVLPQELGATGREHAVDAFIAWVRAYRPGAELDHGYGVTAPKQAPPAPSANYRAQLDDLDRRTGGAIVAASLAARQRAVTEAVTAARIQTLPERPDGGHLATDLMAHFFNGPDANDLAYGRLVGRFSCRGLAASELRPAPLQSPPGGP